MANRFKFGVERKREQLTHQGRRCDGNSRSCPIPAVEQHTVVRAGSDGKPLSGAQTETRQTCSNHRRQYKYSGMWIYLGSSRLSGARTKDETFKAAAA